MQIDIIDTMKAFTAIRANWNAVYDCDPEAQYYLSWPFFETWFSKYNVKWLVLAAKPAPDTPYVAFFPLQIRAEMKTDGTLYSVVKMAGAEFADYRGFIIDPKFETEAIPAFASHIKSRIWTELRLDNVSASAKRFQLFMKSFPQAKFGAEKLRHHANDGTTDNTICPYATLPGSWEAYLTTNLGANARQKAKRFLKKVDEGTEIRITHARTADEVKRDLDVLFGFWEKKWRPRKGEATNYILHNNRTMLMSAFRNDALLMPVFWSGNTALAALGIFIDARKKTLHFLITGRDESFNSPPPGFILHAHTIRWAIQNGYTTYDFMQGNEEYKYMFGVKERHLNCVLVTAKAKRAAAESLDKQTLPIALDLATERHKKGKIAEAERAYGQILDVDPRHVGALYLLAQLKATKGDHKAAKDLFETYLALKPEIANAWVRFGKTLQALADTAGATRAYRKALDLEPKNSEVPPLLLQLSPLNDVLKSMRGAVPKALTERGPAPQPLPLGKPGGDKRKASRSR